MFGNLRLAILLLALPLSGAFTQATGEESDLCPDEKGLCCALDWTGQGATIVKIVGEGMVSQKTFVNANLGMHLNNGERVIALARSTITVAFDDGCRHEVDENEILTIEDVSPCCAGALRSPSPAAPNLAWVPPAAFVVSTIIANVNDDDDDDDFTPPPPISR